MRKWAVYISKSKKDLSKGFYKSPAIILEAKTEQEAIDQIAEKIYVPDGKWTKVEEYGK